MRTTVPSGRDLRVDFFRGLALATIFVNHVPGNFFEQITHRNFGFSDATEVFVFLAGFAAALAYFPLMRGKSLLYVWAKAWRRAFDLYAAHLLAVALGIAILAGAAIHLSDTRFLQWIGLAGLFENTPESLLGIATLGFQPGYFNVLPMYIGLLLLLPLLLVLRARLGLGALLAFSFGLYLLTQLFAWNLPTWPGQGGWYFNPLAWQLLFALGLAVGWAVRQGRVLLGFHLWLYAVASLYVLVALAMKLAEYYPAPGDLPLPFFLYGQEKTFMTLPRVLHLLALVYLIAYLPRAWFSRLNPTGAFTVMGRNALPVFVAGSVLAILAQVLRDALPASSPGRQVAVDLALVSGGLILEIALAKGLQWYRDMSATAKQPSSGRAGGPGLPALPVPTGGT